MIPTFLPPLEYLAIVVIALSICKDADILNMLRRVQRVRSGEPHCVIENNYWIEIKEIALKKLQRDLPRLLRARVVNMLRAISIEYEDWLKDHFFLRTEVRIFCNKYVFHWNSEGRINRLQTAINIIGNRNIHPRNRFLMACIYFRDNEIPPLGRIVSTLKFSENTDINFVVGFWKDWLRRSDHVPGIQMFVEQFRYPRYAGVKLPYRVSAFFHALSRRSRIAYFDILGSPLGHSDDLRECIYQMDREELIELFRREPERILYAFLKWPLVTLFMEMANQLWEYLSPEDFQSVLGYIIKNYISSDLEYFDYYELFREFWDASLDHHKQQVYRCHYYDLVHCILLETKKCFYTFKELFEVYKRNYTNFWWAI